MNMVQLMQHNNRNIKIDFVITRYFIVKITIFYVKSIDISKRFASETIAFD